MRDSGANALKEHMMNTGRLHSILFRGVVALLLAATTSCSGRQEAAPPATAVAAPAAADAPIPQTASPYDALPETVRLVMDQPTVVSPERKGGSHRADFPSNAGALIEPVDGRGREESATPPMCAASQRP